MLISNRRKDRFSAAANIFIQNMCGNFEDISSDKTDGLVNLAGPQTPRLLILSGGVDPTSEIEELAKKHDRYLIQIALEENNSQSYEVFKKCLKDGTWLLLKNCHLAPLWLDKLETHLSSEDLNPDFRLWLTAEEISSFSKAILRRSLKLSVEAPPGLRRSLERISPIWKDKMNIQQLQISLLHVIIQERLGYEGKILIFL